MEQWASFKKKVYHSNSQRVTDALGNKPKLLDNLILSSLYITQKTVKSLAKIGYRFAIFFKLNTQEILSCWLFAVGQKQNDESNMSNPYSSINTTCNLGDIDYSAEFYILYFELYMYNDLCRTIIARDDKYDLQTINWCTHYWHNSHRNPSLLRTTILKQL